MAEGFLDRKAGEDGKPILPSLKVHEFPETMMHPEEVSQCCSLIDFTGASAGLINLLKSYQVGLEFAEDGGDPLQVHPAVHPATMFYVVGNQSEVSRFCCLKRGGACEKGADNGEKATQEAEHKAITHFRALG